MDSDNDPATNESDKTPWSPFEHLPDALPVLRDYEIRQKLLQWNLSDALHLQRFLVHRRLPSEADEALLAEFFQDHTVHQILPLPEHVNSNAESSSKAFSLHFERLRVSVTSLAFFEKLESAGIVARDGSVRGCIDEDFDGCTAGDLLTEMLVNPDSDNCDVFSEQDKQEFIFLLFSTLIIGGGALRQADSRVQAYENVTRELYHIEITSRVYRVSGDALFHASLSRFHSCFAIVDARKRWLTVWYCPFRASW
ncbi:uncharacterized protein PITG_06904 [Phytophthora infestans T30-4]|uniref:Cilia- and flagella-associated protein 300 n=1 Tax=Phytophthora infestans (strain T30-4) TaxID=403677 RepID=D0N6R4_PHYIT|nr:uncharacterized protein PITG_06904 [Phytophthora infestans T30-4]EEY53263.1 conserved hypothetical protein [Phytophthora infestans T30-4]|eukprot:XP_002904881.1 conserved hypothetical protein [Phytophthora infestans T30-4]